MLVSVYFPFDAISVTCVNVCRYYCVLDLAIDVSHHGRNETSRVEREIRSDITCLFLLYNIDLCLCSIELYSPIAWCDLQNGYYFYILQLHFQFSAVFCWLLWHWQHKHCSQTHLLARAAYTQVNIKQDIHCGKHVMCCEIH